MSRRLMANWRHDQATKKRPNFGWTLVRTYGHLYILPFTVFIFEVTETNERHRTLSFDNSLHLHHQTGARPGHSAAAAAQSADSVLQRRPDRLLPGRDAERPGRLRLQHRLRPLRPSHLVGAAAQWHAPANCLLLADVPEGAPPLPGQRRPDAGRPDHQHHVQWYEFDNGCVLEMMLV